MQNVHMAILSTRNLDHKMRETELLWEHFISGSPSPQQLRSTILHSWKRCQEFGVDPKQQRTSISLSSNDLRDLQHNSQLYSVAKPIIDELSAQINETGYLITLCDKYGRIIHLHGDRRVLSKGELMNFVPGADWSEQAAGTNAIGTSIATKSPVQIFSAEHFCQGCHPWICSSAPIIDPLTDETLGALDVTGLWHDAQPHTLGLVTASALSIRQRLSFMQRDGAFYLADRYHQASIRWPEAIVLMLDPQLQVVKGEKDFTRHWNLDQLEWQQAAEWKPLIDELHSLARHPHSSPYSEAAIPALNTHAYLERLSFQNQHLGYLIVLPPRRQAGFFSAPAASAREKEDGWQGIIGGSVSVVNIIERCKQIADVDVPLLLTGESGTGKEVIARAVHQSGSRSGKPFVAVNCGAIPRELIASELFGYESGTFTGGTQKGKKGLFEEADGGTMFLDEIGEMPLDLQVHLLRVLQEKEVVRLGSSKPVPVNVRIIAATNRDLTRMMTEKQFRQDLFYRLNVVSLHVPPLRERKEDIPLLARYYLNRKRQKYRKPVESYTAETLAFFHSYHWPGNIRELQNTVEHAVLFTRSAEIGLADLPPSLLHHLKSAALSEEGLLSPMELEEKQTLERLLQRHGGNLSAIARECRIARSTLYRKLNKYHLSTK